MPLHTTIFIQKYFETIVSTLCASPIETAFVIITKVQQKPILRTVTPKIIRFFVAQGNSLNNGNFCIQKGVFQMNATKHIPFPSANGKEFCVPKKGV